MRHAPLKTLAALTIAAAFGGFAATAMRDAVDQPARAEPPAGLILFAMLSGLSSRLCACTWTCTPSVASRRHIAAPMPPLPPVTSAYFTLRFQHYGGPSLK